MAAAAYSTDLVTITDGETTTNWAESSASGWTNGNNPSIEPDFYIHGTSSTVGNCVAKYNPNNPVGQNGMLFNAGSGLSFPESTCFFAWVNNQCPNNMDTEAANGLELLIGSSISAFKAWTILGKDTYTYGGWVCGVVDPTVAASRTIGSPTSTLQYFGVGVKYLTTAKGGLGVDIMRYGRGQLKCLSGDVGNGYATFTGAASANDAITARWGLLQATASGFLYKGLLLLGDATTAVDFRDSNKNITVEVAKKVSSTFNTIEIRNAASRVDWTGISILSINTVSRGDILVTDNADVNFSGNSFANMGTFKYLSNTTDNSSSYRACNQITPSGAAMTSCSFISSNDTSGAVLATSPSDISGLTYCNFTNNTRAIKITTAGTYNFVGHQFSGNTYQVDFTGSGTCTIIPSNGCNVAQGSCTASGGGTIVVDAPSVNLTLTGLISGSEVRIIKVSDGSELGGVESSSTSYTFSHTLGGTTVHIYVHSNEYQWYPIYNYVLSASDASIPVQQIKDRQYLNP